jgi:hypothetical protein
MCRKRPFIGLIKLAAFLSFCVAAATAFGKDKPVSWKEIENALLRVNDAPVKEWGVFQSGKKRDPLLVQIGTRFLLIKIHEREIFEVDASTVKRRPDELLWNPNDHPAQPLAISDWDASEMEALFRIRARINTEDRLLDIELPHQLDLSGMTPHAVENSR